MTTSMPEALIFEFRDASPDLYDTVNKLLGLDPGTGEGDWPEGIVSHAAGVHPDGNGPALGQAGVAEPTRVEWMPLKGYHAG